jgi:carbonic anhydrase
MVASLLHGHRSFLQGYAKAERQYLERLASEGQNPDAVFIGCSDSRVVPELLTKSSPGALFVVRNVANIVPPSHGMSPSVAAALEYSVGVLKVSDVIVCGHEGCGGVQAAMQGLERLDHLPGLQAWLKYAAPGLDQLTDPDADDDVRLQFAVEENVLHQLDQLMTYKVVRDAVEAGALTLHGWIYDLHSSGLRVFNGEKDMFLPPDHILQGA